MNKIFKKLKTLYSVNNIWILYRIENNEIKTFGYCENFERAKRWADAGEYKILECKQF